MMTATKQVMVREHENIEFGKRVTFRNADFKEPPADRGPYAKVVLSVEDWREMGEPAAITVSIEPGDKLNA